MNEPQRYKEPFCGEGPLIPDARGDYIAYEDYEKLKAETVKQLEAAMPPIKVYIAKLEAEVERLTKDDAKWHELCEKFADKVERLTEAGDEMANAIGWAMARTDGREPRLVENWNAAKDGKHKQ
jgi:hypothetical protein